MARSLIRVLTCVLVLAAAVLWWQGGSDEPQLAPNDVRASRGGDAAATADRAVTGAAPHTERDAAVPPEASATPAAAAHDTAATAALTVLVRDDRGAALAGCAVRADGEDAITDREGAARFVLAPGRRLIEVTPARGAQLQPRRGRQWLRAGEATTVVVVLAPRHASVCWCRLVAAEDGSPQPRAVVRSEPSGNLLQVDEQGFVALTTGADDTHADVVLAGRAPRRIVPPAGHEDRALALQVPLHAAATLALEAVDGAGAPVAGCTLQLRVGAWQVQWPDRAPSTGADLRWSATTDAAGRATIDGLPADLPMQATVVAPAPFAPPAAALWRLAAPRDERRLLLVAGGTLRGRVLLGDVPLPSVLVRAVPDAGTQLPRRLRRAAEAREATTSMDGTFSLEGLAPGPWCVGVADSESSTSDVLRVEIAAAGHHEVTIAAAAAAVVTGRALLPDGGPAADIAIDAYAAEDWVGGARTDADGAFTIAGLRPEEVHLDCSTHDSDFGLAAPATVRAGGPPVILRLQPVRGTLTGRVAVASDDAWVSAHRRGHDEAIGSRTDLDGTFVYSGLPAGTWDVNVVDGEGRVGIAGSLEVLPGRTTDVGEIALRPGGTLRPRHAAADEFLVLRDGQVLARDNLLAGAAGQANVPAGPCTVSFRRDGVEIARRDVTAVAGAAVNVDG